MLSLGSVILNLFGDSHIIQVRRFPLVKYLHVHVFGLAFSLSSVLATTCLNLPDLLINLEWYVPCVLLTVFAVGSWLGGTFVLLTGLLYFLPMPSTPFAGIWTAFLVLARCYFAAYAFGAIFASLYNDTVFFYCILLAK